MDNNTTEREIFKQAINQLPYGIGMYDLSTEKPLFLNDAYYALVGCTPAEYAEMHKDGASRRVFPADSSVKERSARAFRESGKALNYEYRIIRKDGTIRWVKMNATTMQVGGERFACASFLDVTKEKETYLQISLIAENVNSSIALYRVECGNETLVYANERFFALLGVPREIYVQDVHAYDHGCVSEQDHLRIREAILYAYRTGQPSEIEHEFIRPDGQRLWLNRKYRAIPQDKADTFMLVVVVSDCTAKKKAQDAEHEQNLMMSNLLNQLPGGVAIFRVTDKLEYTYFNDGFATMTGRTRDEVARMLQDEQLLKQSVPLENYHDFVNRLKANQPIGKTLSFTYHLYLASGEIAWLHVSATKIREENGCPVYYCIYTNPTDETALYRSIVEDSAIGVFVADRKTRTNYYANEALCRLCGFEADKIAGIPLDSVLHQYGRQPLLSAQDVASLRYDAYSEFHAKRKGLYLDIKAKALLWNGVDSYILYIADETSAYKEQLQLEQTLLKEQTLMGAISGGTAIYRIKKDGAIRMEYASDGTCAILGYSQKELLALPSIKELITPEDRPAVLAAMQKAVEYSCPICMLMHGIAKDGTTFLSRLDAKVLLTGDLAPDEQAVLYAVHSEISDASKLAMQEQQYYRMILNMTGTAYFEWDREKGFYSSEDYKQYALSEGGYETILGNRQWADCVHPDDIAVLQHYVLSNFQKNSRNAVTVRMKLRDGHYRWTEVVSYSEKDEAGKIRKTIGVLRDVDKEWIEKNKRLQAALDAAEAANRAKTAFLSRVSHDMRTPLNGILGLTAFLKDSITDEQAARDISQLEISGQYLLNLINDTLDVSRIENGRLELHPVVCDAKQTFDNIIKLVRPNIESRNQKLVLHMEQIAYVHLYMDVSRFEQVVMNIVGNAVKFTPDGGTITCTLSRVAQTEDCVTDRITIRDTGIGMSKAFLPMIFDPFSQADNTQKNARQGTGLGMAITKQLVDQMGGSISVESELGKGSCFTIVMPFQRATEEQVAAWKASLAREADNSILKGKRVLLCEDHPLNREIATRMLQNKGMLVEYAENGQAGVERFAGAAPGWYDLVLMDVRMPVMDGLDATRAIRRLAKADAHTVPIIAMTGNSFDEDIAQTMDAGMNAHLSKPIDPVKLFETLGDQLAHARVFRRKKVLVVDDVELNRALIVQAIAQDYDVVQASDGAQAFALLEKDQGIDAVITDVMMLPMDGLALTRQIRANPQYDHIPILANTQYEAMTRQDEMIAAGVNGFLYKPNTPEDTRAKLHAVMAAANSEKEKASPGR